MRVGDLSETLVLVLSITLFLCGCGDFNTRKTVRLVPGLVLTESVVIEADHYQLTGDSLGAIQIQGDGITVDFNHAILDGGLVSQAPDEFSGTGIRVSGSGNVTIKNAVVKGYKVGVMVTDAPDFRITSSDLSYNWRQRLKSTIERESSDDWMSYHQNDDDEWLRFGAAIYLHRSDRAQVDHVKVTGGHNGIMATRVNDALFYNNSITFNSAIGIGLYRSSRNRILHNRLDFNVRGHSPGVYNRGQDSAALLLYEQSNENVIAYNSATHSGDGLFLWAGQSTMDSGEGGCNDNMIFSNDFSFAPTNGIEVTFSRNQILGNRIEGCWHGIWGGYSYDTLVEGNEFVNNEEHIAIEHGQHVTISQNQFTGGDIGLRLWQRRAQPEDWGYAKNRDVRSRDYLIIQNDFQEVADAIQSTATTNITISQNSFSSTVSGFEESDSLHLTDNRFGEEILRRAPKYSLSLPPRLPDGQDVALEAHIRTGRSYMLIDEWGPYDFRSPVLWPRSRRSSTEQTFELLGPAGRWRISSLDGIEWISRSSGEHFLSVQPDTLRIRLPESGVIDMMIELEFIGEEITDRFGRTIERESPFVFSYSHFYLPIDWTVSFFEYNESTDPRAAFPAFRRLLDTPPMHVESTRDLAYQWYSAPAASVPADQFATVAEGSFIVPEGRYELDLTSDDGVRIWLDSALLHDDWTYHAPRQETIPVNLGGAHTIRVEHFEIDGYATLIVSFRRVDDS